MFWFIWDTVKHKITIELLETEETALFDRVNPTRMYFGGVPILMHGLCQSDNRRVLDRF